MGGWEEGGRGEEEGAGGRVGEDRKGEGEPTSSVILDTHQPKGPPASFAS